MVAPARHKYLRNSSPGSGDSRISVIGGLTWDTITNIHFQGQETLGGAAAYFGLSARQYTSSVSLFGFRSNTIPEETLRRLADKIDISSLRIAPESSLKFSIYYDRSWKARYVTDNPGALQAIDSHVARRAIRLARAVHLCPLASLRQQLQLAQGIRQDKPEIFISVMIFGPRLNEASSELQRLLQVADLVFLSNEDLEHAAGIVMGDLTEVSRRCRASLVITLGESGACFVSGGRETYYRCERTDPVDVTGAGDSFSGAFIGSLMKGYPIDRCLRNASLLAKISILSLGASDLLALPQGS